MPQFPGLASPVYLAAGLALAYATAALLAACSTFYARHVDSDAKDRHRTLDGLRGFAAMGVFLSHVVLTKHYRETGAWSWDGWEHGGAAMCGRAGVWIFFMLTGFLFWERVIGPTAIDWRRLFANRVRRLTPLYLFCVGMVMLTVAWKTGFVRRVPWPELAIQAASWLAFDFVPLRDVNGFAATALLTGGVFWTLPYEWCFYASLPILSPAAPRRRFAALAALVAALVAARLVEPVLLCFVAGMSCAYLAGSARAHALAKRRLATALAIAATAVLFRYDFDSPAGIALTALVFVIVSGGNSIGGVLTSRAARVLGTVSYSVYLLHGLCLYLAAEALAQWRPIGGMSAGRYWLHMAPVIAVVVAICAVTYRAVEHPFLRGVRIRQAP
jgi:peptidoglycan/LPS O-acetylase OafA/YrhL